MPRTLKNLLFSNIGIRQTVIKNTFWLVLAEVITKLLGLILIIYVVRILGATEYGKFTFAFSFVSLMAIFSDLGIIDISIREFSRNKENEKKISEFFTLELVLCLIALVATVIVSFFITSDSAIRTMIWILIVYILSTNLLGVMLSFIKGRQKMEYEAAIKIVNAAVTTLVAFLVLFYIPSPKNLSFGYMASSLAVLFFIIIFFNKSFWRISLKWKKSSLHILKISWPLSIGFVGLWLYVLINSVMLGYFNLITENGWYGAALKVTLIASIPADLIARSFYPMLSGLFFSSKEKFQKGWDYMAESMIYIALPMVTGGMVMAPKIIDFLYGPNFMPSILAFQLLILATSISFISYPYSVVLVVADKQKNNFIFIILGALINIVLNTIFIPIYGWYGSIIATIVASIIVLVALVIYSKKISPISFFNKNILKAVLMSGLASFLMYFAISRPIVSALNVVFVCSIGVLVYAFSLLLLYKVVLRKKIFDI